MSSLKGDKYIDTDVVFGVKDRADFQNRKTNRAAMPTASRPDRRWVFDELRFSRESRVRVSRRSR